MRPTTLAQNLWPVTAERATPRMAALVALGVCLLTVSAKISVPFTPVPMTMQTFAVLVIGAFCGARLGLATVVAYLAVGLAGAPVFQGGGGVAYAAGPTGGFLIGFAAAAALVGALADRGYGRSLVASLAIMALGHAVIFALGFAWLASLIGPAKAWAGGVAPFALATLLKTLLAAALVPALWNVAARRG